MKNPIMIIISKVLEVLYSEWHIYLLALTNWMMMYCLDCWNSLLDKTGLKRYSSTEYS